MIRIAIMLAATIGTACSNMAPPDGVVVLDGPDGTQDVIGAVVDAWASHGAAIEVGQVGPCQADGSMRCRRESAGTHWSVVIVQDGTQDGAGVVLCEPDAESVVHASTDYDTQTIWVGECARKWGRLAEVISHEVGHVLLGSDYHASEGVMVSSDPVTIEPGNETLERACSLGWGC
jgi:hypothetical protein